MNNRLRAHKAMNVQVDHSVFVAEQVRTLTPSTYVLRFSRNDMAFNPGQHLVLGLPGSEELREYSIYSGNGEPHLEVLIKEVDEGSVSKVLKSIGPGNPLVVKGPHGFFLDRAAENRDQRHVMIASGTGIAPFHSFVKTHPESDFRIIHGVRSLEEAYDLADYPRDRITVCTSRDASGDFHGRLTEYLVRFPLRKDDRVYLCGNSQMIYNAMEILHRRGIPQRHIHTEVYF